ncbi:aspartate kinase [Pelobium manganitolerans]|uniref:Aspartokinase n=1 Tax=Pelobium manganitolerans TaxID=1842495 RepID=A0A419S314_9SPHI|nr:aspartate kinase [Pelobium manganitolerans]RKD13673.1 aspartate kinase [Pelobium manganitolerans]
MQVFKFGGASVKDATGIKNLAQIVSATHTGKLLVVVSAMGKTTNALEKLAQAYFNQQDDAHQIFEEIKAYHFKVLHQLFAEGHPVFDEINNTFVEIDWIIEDEPADPFDFIYDQIVSVGELVSSKIIAHYLAERGVKSRWLDARAYVQTDNSYREAHVNWEKTAQLIQKDIPQILEQHIAVVPGFIGNTSENFTTTLGREGSDYSAAIFAACLNAESVTVWKDVPGVLNADPKRFENCIKFEELSYAEAIEMTYYGATVIHPKTIKPLQNKSIPLFVKPFLNPAEAGTVIKASAKSVDTPIIIVKEKQTLITLHSKQAAFISESQIAGIFKAFADARIKVNTLQVSALTFSASFDSDEPKFESFKQQVPDFDLRYNDELKLITIRHGNAETFKEFVKGEVYLEERNRITSHFVVKA